MLVSAGIVEGPITYGLADTVCGDFRLVFHDLHDLTETSFGPRPTEVNRGRIAVLRDNAAAFI